MKRREGVAALAALAALALGGAYGCTNNYGQFDFKGGSGGTQAGSGGAQAGSGGALGGAGGTALGGSGGGTSCGAGQMPCGGSCVSTNSLHACGGCNNDCAALGLECVSGVCGCSQNNQCGQAGNDNCRTTSAVCDCGGQRCARGETCRRQGGNSRCSCGGGNTRCQFGQTCCQTPSGCFNLRSDRNNCGGCGHACPSGQNCVNGSCG